MKPPRIYFRPRRRRNRDEFDAGAELLIALFGVIVLIGVFLGYWVATP